MTLPLLGAYVVLAVPPLLVFGMVMFNVWAWPRGRVLGRFAGRVSVLIPARNEAETIGRCVRAALGGSCPPDEVLVYDDGSTDATAEAVARLAAADARVRLLPGKPLPEGWVGKPHACHHLAAAATGDVLVFVDADTVLTPSGLARLAWVMNHLRADVATAGVRQVTRTPAERLVIPLLHLSYLAWLPVPLVWRTRDPRLLIANGQLLAVTRAAYEQVGGWAAVRCQVVDDMAFCRRAKVAGLRVAFADGHHMATCRMYRNVGELWRGFSKNLYEGIGGTVAALTAVVVLHLWVFVLPYAALLAGAAGVAAGFVSTNLIVPAAVGVAANVGLRAVLAVRFRQPVEGVVLHPVAVLAMLAIALNSYLWNRRGAIRWRDRTYAAPGDRGRAATPPVSV